MPVVIGSMPRNSADSADFSPREGGAAYRLRAQHLPLSGTLRACEPLARRRTWANSSTSKTRREGVEGTDARGLRRRTRWRPFEALPDAQLMPALPIAGGP